MNLTERMRADVLVELTHATSTELLGRRVLTDPMGEWPGGIATICELAPDPAAPEIVFNVKADFWPDDDGPMGVFGYEEVELQKEGDA